MISWLHYWAYEDKCYIVLWGAVILVTGRMVNERKRLRV